MTVSTAVGAFTLAAAIATVTPGLDTALILRTAAVEGRRRAFMAAIGIGSGVLVWGTAAAFGLGELFRASSLAYEIVRWTGAAYLLYLGVRMLLSPRIEFVTSATDNESQEVTAQSSAIQWFVRGMLTNLLNPKVGVFYVSFLPQFIPKGVANPSALMMLFAAIHAVEGVLWFSVLIAATERLAPLLRRSRVVKTLDQAMGALFIGFGVKLAFEKRA